MAVTITDIATITPLSQPYAMRHFADGSTLFTERAANKSLTIARRQLALGDISHLTLLNAQQTYQQTRINLVQAQANRYADTAALFQALGGGWWNRNDPAPLPGRDHAWLTDIIAPRYQHTSQAKP